MENNTWEHVWAALHITKKWSCEFWAAETLTDQVSFYSGTLRTSCGVEVLQGAVGKETSLDRQDCSTACVCRCCARAALITLWT